MLVIIGNLILVLTAHFIYLNVVSFSILFSLATESEKNGVCTYNDKVSTLAKYCGDDLTCCPVNGTAITYKCMEEPTTGSATTLAVAMLTMASAVLALFV